MAFWASPNRPAFSNASGFGASSSPAFGSSAPAFGTSSSPAFETTSTHPFGGSSAFGQNPASERSGFNTSSSLLGNPSWVSQPTMRVLGTQTIEASSKPAFGVSSIPVTSAFGVSSTPAASAFGASASSTSSSFSFAPAPFGTLNGHSPTPFDVASIPVNPFGARATTLSFGDHGFSQFKPVGSRVYSYAQTPEVDIGTQPAGNLVSISAMRAYKGKTHEELRWEDYQLGDKGDPNLFPSTTPTPTPAFGVQHSTFGTPGVSSFTHPLNSSPSGLRTSTLFAPAQTPSVSNSTPFPPFGTPTSPSPSPSPFGTPTSSNPSGPAQAQTPSVFNTASSYPFGTPTSFTSFRAPYSGTPCSIPSTTQAQGTTSSFANGINPGTQSANLFQSSSPALGQPSSQFGQPPFRQPAGSPSVQAAPPFLSSPFQSAQTTQNPAYFVAQTGGNGGFDQNRFEQMFTNLFGALQAMRQMSTTVAGEPAPMRLSCMSSNDASFMMLEFQNLKL